MATGTGVTSVMVEFNRFGVEGNTLQKGTSYIRTTGDERAACEIKVGLGYREFVRSFYALRYAGASATDVDTALHTLGQEADAMLSGVVANGDGTIQLDIVTSAAELWAFPFEAFASERRDIVITRRIRGAFGQHVAWPATPKVLFVHAAITGDLKQELIDQHVAALTDALEPWTGGADPTGKLLFVKEVYSLADLEKARTGDFTHIHVLAHGKEVESLDGPPLKDWGMRFGAKGSAGDHPSKIASVLAPRNGLPVAITMASCDSANQSDSAAASYSVAHELHRLGVPVVVASQLPLTMYGSVVLTKYFYATLLGGADVREALHVARNALREEPDAKHDWLSVVAYVRLPETYDDHLDRVALKIELAMLRVAHKRMDALLRKNDLAGLADVEEVIRERIESLTKRLETLRADEHDEDRVECQGLLASAYKRLAELLFLAGRSPDEQRQALEKSLQHYRDVFQSHVDMHWHGVQQLALQAVLTGACDALDYKIVLRGAQASAKNDDQDYWPLGTLAELSLLGAYAGATLDADAARAAIVEFRDLAALQPDDIDSTRRQLQRYAKWWTAEHGFKTNVGEIAASLAALLPEEEIA